MRSIFGAGPAGRAEDAGPAWSWTLEVRWIHPGQMPAGIIDRLGPFHEEIERREDRYLVDPLVPELGVKIRDHVQLDVKAFRGSPGELALPGRARGRMEFWEKWNLPFEPGGAPPPDAPGWLSLRKARRRRSFRVEDGRVIERPLADVASPGCTMELTEVTTVEGNWWTLGFESNGPRESPEPSLRATAGSVLREPLPDDLELDPRDAMSYVRWLSGRANDGT